MRLASSPVVPVHKGRCEQKMWGGGSSDLVLLGGSCSKSRERRADRQTDQDLQHRCVTNLWGNVGGNLQRRLVQSNVCQHSGCKAVRCENARAFSPTTTRRSQAYVDGSMLTEGVSHLAPALTACQRKLRVLGLCRGYWVRLCRPWWTGWMGHGFGAMQTGWNQGGKVHSILCKMRSVYPSFLPLSNFRIIKTLNRT
jgi:hypothetical protein